MYVPVFGFGKLWLEEVCGWAGAFSFRAVLGLLFLVRVGFFVSFSASPSGSASRSGSGSDFWFGFGGHAHTHTHTHTQPSLLSPLGGFSSLGSLVPARGLGPRASGFCFLRFATRADKTPPKTGTAATQGRAAAPRKPKREEEEQRKTKKREGPRLKALGPFRVLKLLRVRVLVRFRFRLRACLVFGLPPRVSYF